MKYIAKFEFEFEAESADDAKEFISEIQELTKIDEIEEYLSKPVKFERKLGKI